MTKPEPRRCGICNVVTARYAGLHAPGLLVWAGEVMTHTLEPADLEDPDLDHLAETYDQYVQGLLDKRAELIAQHRTRSIALECIEQDLMRLGVEL